MTISTAIHRVSAGRRDAGPSAACAAPRQICWPGRSCCLKAENTSDTTQCWATYLCELIRLSPLHHLFCSKILQKQH